jgi:hypothetical protein
LSRPAADDPRSRKERDKRSLQRATIAVGVAALGLAGALTYAAAAATSGSSSNTNPGPTDPTTVTDPNPAIEPSDIGEMRPPATSLSSPAPGVAPVAVTGAS